MKKIFIHINKKGIGEVKIIPEHKEDIWHLYNLVAKGDLATALAYRKISNKTGSASAKTIRVPVRPTISVESIQVDLDSGLLRLSGPTQIINEHIPLGRYQSLKINLNSKLTLQKEHWDSLAKGRLREALHTESYADLAVVLMQRGSANLFLVTPLLTLHKAKVDVQIPKKKTVNVSKVKKAENRFHEMVFNTIQQNVNFDVVKCLIIASPGFYKNDFAKWLRNAEEQSVDRSLFTPTQNFIYVHCSSGHKEALDEILEDHSVQNKIKFTRNAMENALFDEFLRLLAKENDQAVVGLSHVEQAGNKGAIRDLLVSDEFVRSSDVALRKRLEVLKRKIEKRNGKIHILSSLQSVGEKLKGIGGITAILNFSVPCEDETED